MNTSLETAVRSSELAVNTAQIQQETQKTVKGIPFKKGVSGNPKGKPKGTRNYYTDFRIALKQITNPETGKSYTEVDLLKISVEKMLDKIKSGDSRYDRVFLDILDRVYGKPTQGLDHTTQGEKFVPVITGMRIMKDWS